MLIEKHRADNVFRYIPGLTLKMSPELAAIDGVLDDEELFCMIRDDLSKHYPNTLTLGRNSTPVEVILRMLAVRHLYNLSYEKIEQQATDSLVLRQFCRVYFNPVADHTTLCRWAKEIQPATLAAFNDRLMGLAIEAKLTRGRKLRSDAVVVETNIHYPTDSSLLADGVRVLGRILGRAKALIAETGGLARQTFRNRSRSAKRVLRQMLQAKRQGRQLSQPLYRRLVQITQASVRQADQVLQALCRQARQEGGRLIQTLESFLPRIQQVLHQTVRRVFQGQSVPAGQKLVSLFEPHTDIIRRGKPNQDTEFGHKLWLGEVEGGFISQCQVLDGNPPDSAQWQPGLERHVEQFGRPPRQASADRGVSSADNEAYAQRLGIERIILPQPGANSEVRCRHERQGRFRRGRHFHAGIEGRISVISRKHGMDRCRNKGLKGF